MHRENSKWGKATESRQVVERNKVPYVSRFLGYCTTFNFVLIMKLIAVIVQLNGHNKNI